MLPSRKKVACGGIWCSVYGLQELAQKEVTAVFLLHGRFGSAEGLEEHVRHTYQLAEAQRRSVSPTKRPLIFITFDQRNHGTRLISKKGQQSWTEGKEGHAQDMLSMLVGTAADVSLLADHLPSTLFPLDEVNVAEWMVAGISLGAHSVWHVLKNDQRFRVGVPIIGCPSYRKLMQQRAVTSRVSFGPPYMPKQLMKLLSAIDPDSTDYASTEPARNPFWGKKVLSLHGADDDLVPFSCSEQFLTGLEVGGEGYKSVIAEPGRKHETTDFMISQMANFLVDHQT